MSKTTFFDAVALNGKTAAGRAVWQEDWGAWATITALGANGPFDTKAEAKPALRRELRGNLAENCGAHSGPTLQQHSIERDNTMINNRELSTVLAALRYWQREGLHSSGHERDIATDEGLYQAMTSAEIDALADRLNSDGSSIAGDGDDRKRLQALAPSCWMTELLAQHRSDYRRRRTGKPPLKAAPTRTDGRGGTTTMKLRSCPCGGRKRERIDITMKVTTSTELRALREMLGLGLAEAAAILRVDKQVIYDAERWRNWTIPAWYRDALLGWEEQAQHLISAIMHGRSKYLITYPYDDLYDEFEPEWSGRIPLAMMHMTACARAKAELAILPEEEGGREITLVALIEPAYRRFLEWVDPPLTDDHNARQAWAGYYLKRRKLAPNHADRQREP